MNLLKQKLNTHLKSFLQFSFGTWVSAGVSFISTPIISWLILPNEFGKAAMFTLAHNFMVSVGLLGTDQSFSRFFFDNEISNKQTLLGSSLLFPILSSLVFSVIVVVFWPSLSVFLFSEIAPIHISYLLCLSTLAGILARYSLIVLRMQLKAKLYSILLIFSSVANIIIVLVYARFVSNNFNAIILGFIASNLFTILLGTAFEPAMWKKFYQFDQVLVKKILIYGVPFIPTFILEWLFQAVDRFFLRTYSTLENIGLYTASFKIVSILNLIQAGFTLFWVPFSIQKYNENPEDKQIFKQMFNVVSFTFFLFFFSIILFKNFIIYLFAASYYNSLFIFPFLLFIPILYTLSEITVSGITFLKKTKLHIWVSLISLIVCFITGYFLIPILDVKGAALASCAGYLAFFTSRTLMGNKLYYVQYQWWKFVVSLLTALSVAYFNTFCTAQWMNYLSVLGIIIIAFLYIDDLKKLICRSF